MDTWLRPRAWEGVADPADPADPTDPADPGTVAVSWVQVIDTCDPHLASGARSVRCLASTCRAEGAPSARARGPAWRPPA